MQGFYIYIYIYICSIGGTRFLYSLLTANKFRLQFGGSRDFDGLGRSPMLHPIPRDMGE